MASPTPNLTLVEHLSNKKKPKTCIHLHKIQIILCLTSKKTRSLLLFVLIRFFHHIFLFLKTFLHPIPKKLYKPTNIDMTDCRKKGKIHAHDSFTHQNQKVRHIYRTNNRVVYLEIIDRILLLNKCFANINKIFLLFFFLNE